MRIGGLRKFILKMGIQTIGEALKVRAIALCRFEGFGAAKNVLNASSRIATLPSPARFHYSGS